MGGESVAHPLPEKPYRHTYAWYPHGRRQVPNRMLVAVITVMVLAMTASLAAEGDDKDRACQGLSIVRFESRLPATVRRLTITSAMLGPFVELWKTGARPALPNRPERVVIYALPDLPFIVGYEKNGCIIAYLTIDSADLWRWLRPRLGWRI